MKRILSLVLAMVMVLGSFSAVFAAEQTAAEKAGAFLQDAGVLQGNAGDLMLDKDLRRRDAVVLLSRLMDKEEEAKEFPSKDLKFNDITDSYYTGFVAWAVANGIVNGKSATKFDPNGDLEARDFATMLLRALGHEVTGDAYTVALETAKKLGLLEDVAVENETTVTRGTMAIMTFNTLGTKMKDSTETLADKLGIEMPAPEVSTDIEITSAVAIANNKVEVKVKEEVNASKADFTIVKKGTTTAVEVKDVVKESAKVFVLETEALVGGTAYTLKSNGKSINFTGIAADKSAPTVVKLSAKDTNTFEIEFTDKMDFVTVTDVKNYTVDKDLKVVKVELDSTRKFATVTTDSAKRGVVYSITIENVINSDGVAMAKTTRRITAVEDKIVPRLDNVRVQNNRMLVVRFLDANGMDKESVEDLANYTINDLAITSAKAYDTDSDGLLETVVLMTETQTANKGYTLTIEGVKDGSVLGNALVKTARAFRGSPEDKTSPVVVAPVKSQNNNKVVIDFFDNNAMSTESLEDIGNYVITLGNNEVLPILEAKASDTTYPRGYTTRRVTLTTAPQELNKSYRVEVKGVEDEFGNALKPVSGSTYAKYYFTSTPVDVTAPFVRKVEYVNSTTVKLTFDEVLNRATATDPTNYIINGKIDTVIKASLSASGTVLTLTTQPLGDNGSYVITINNVEDSYSNVMLNVKVSFIATASSLDTVAPSLVHVYAVNNKEIHLNFDERINTPATGIQIKKGTDAAITLNHVGEINGATTIVYVLSSGTLADGTYELVGTNSATDLFKDAAGNGYLPKANEGNLVYTASNIINTAPEVDYVEQIDTKTLKVVFNEPVTGSIVSGLSASTDPTYDSHLTEWYLSSNTNFVVGKEYTLNFSSMTDLVGTASTTTAYKFTPWYEDLTPPTIIGVAAVDNSTVVVSYDEDIEVTGRYRIYYYDDASGKQVNVYAGLTGTIAPSAPSEVRISVSGLSNSRIYYLEVLTGARDIAGNREEIVGGNNFDFYGSNVVKDDFITGVSIINATTIKTFTTKTIVGLTVYELEEGTSAYTRKLEIAGNVINETTTRNRFESTGIPFLSGIKYEVEVDFGLGLGTQTYRFDGITTDLGLTLTSKDVNTLTVNFPGYDDASYDVAVFGENGNVVLSKTATTSTKDLTVTAHGLVATDVAYVVLYNRLDGSVLNAAKVEVR